MSTQRKIIHIDMDCFYAAVEMRDDPSLKHKAIAVGGSPDNHGVLTTCNYQARKFGLHSAMSSSQALRLCPGLILLPVNMPAYRAASEAIHSVFLEHCECIEPLSLDEAFLDVTGLTDFQGSATRLAEKIRFDVFAKTKLTCSAGISCNKFLAKVASDWKKPNAQFTIHPADIAEFMPALPVKKIPGVGPVTAKKLAYKGIENCGDLQKLSQESLQDTMGKFGLRLYNLSRGMDDRPVEPDRIRKSASVEHTFTDSLTGFEACLQPLDELYIQLKKRLERHSDRDIRKQFVKIKWADFTLLTKECIVSSLYESQFKDLLKDAIGDNQQKIRLLGIGVRFYVVDDSEHVQLPLEM